MPGDYYNRIIEAFDEAIVTTEDADTKRVLRDARHYGEELGAKFLSAWLRSQEIKLAVVHLTYEWEAGCQVSKKALDILGPDMGKEYKK